MKLAPAAGSVSVTRFRLRHRLSGATGWTIADIPAADASVVIDGYVTGDVVEMQAMADAAFGLWSDWTPLLTVTVGANDAPIPAALDPARVAVSALPGGARIDFVTGTDAATTAVQIYRSTAMTLDPLADKTGAPIAVVPSRRWTSVVGDGTRENLLANPDFTAAGSWSTGAGWTITGGKANHAAGSAGTLAQAVTLVAGRNYRLAATLSAVSGGSLTPQLTGGTTRSGTAATAAGRLRDRILAVTGNNAFALAASAAFVGGVDDVVLYEETDTCLAQETHRVYLEPINADGVAGPVAGPFTVIID